MLFRETRKIEGGKDLGGGGGESEPRVQCWTCQV